MNRFFLAGTLIFLAIFSWGQHEKEGKLNYISPRPGSINVMPNNNIALRNGLPFDSGSLSKKLLQVSTSTGAVLTGKFFLSTDERTLIFQPFKPFPLGTLFLLN